MMYRLPAVAGEWIDRSRTLAFEFEGRAFQGFAGDTVSSALAAAGEMTLGRSFKYHRRRGIFSFANHDANNLFQVGHLPNVRGDVTALEDGMRISAVNTRGGLARDRARFIEWLAPFLPVGFYYKAFHGRNFPRWEQRIRAISGLGRIAADASRERTPKRYAFCDVLVVGAGASGLATALSAADAGAHVLLVDENARPGGCATWTGAAAGEVETLVSRVVESPRIELLPGTYVAGVYADRWVALVEPSRMTKVRAGAVVFATGVIEQPAVFRNNDLPGVLLGSAAQRLLRRHAIAPGKRVAILTANREGYELARDLRAHDIGVAAVLDLRADPGGDSYGLGDLRCVAGVVPEAAMPGSDGAVRALRVRAGETIACDALLMSVGFAPASALLSQAGAVMQYDMALQQHVPVKLPPGFFATGRVNGTYDSAARRQDGRDVGAAAAAYAQGGHAGTHAARPERTRPVSHPYPVFPHPSGRDFVDLDEDIQVKDLLTSAQEGFDSPELMKRFSTLGMGPSQGKLSNLHGARILVRSRDATLADTALTTQRPFYHPMPLKHLAGMGFHAHRHSSVHDRHVALDARFMTVGGWQRPEYYQVSGQSRADCIAAEARAVREGAGLIDVSTLGKIEIFGPDAGAFLDRIYTGSFSDLRVGMTRYGLLLDEGGIVRDDGVIARLADRHFYFTTTTSGAASVYRELLLWNTRWRMDCAFVNATGHRAAFNLAGPRSRERLQALTGIDLSETAFPFLAVREGRVAGVEARVLRAGFVSSLGFEVHVPFGSAGAVWDALMKAGGVRAFGVEAQRVLRLEKGHAIVAQDTDNLTNPFEAGMGWAVRMQKPFFVGQRSLRIHVRRGARQKLVGFELAPEQVASGAAIRESNLLIHLGGIAGRVTSVAQSPTLGRTIGLAMANPSLAAPGTPIVIRASDGRLVSARVVRTPFLEAE
ncbi:MAG TPA: 2Fe-2S iron-sulfur cluster-binding protein [Steroidobacteraceae bacterium]|nr:2Fe-2S iron-sulfur cluster-binding protein [Steroidobacteraceae bacterium]